MSFHHTYNFATLVNFLFYMFSEMFLESKISTKFFWLVANCILVSLSINEGLFLLYIFSNIFLVGANERLFIIPILLLHLLILLSICSIKSSVETKMKNKCFWLLANCTLVSLSINEGSFYCILLAKRSLTGLMNVFSLYQ